MSEYALIQAVAGAPEPSLPTCAQCCSAAKVLRFRDGAGYVTFWCGGCNVYLPTVIEPERYRPGDAAEPEERPKVEADYVLVLDFTRRR